VRGVDRDPVRREFIESLISLSHEMGIPVIAEGIETVGECQTVTELGGDLMQGFLFRKADELGLDERFQLAQDGWTGA
jgi:EAL domain-containing protein (putative c-di-GMP-specific phosphodiesterase class I)